jgi:Protein of unknown function (DUF2785)
LRRSCIWSIVHRRESDRKNGANDMTFVFLNRNVWLVTIAFLSLALCGFANYARPAQASHDMRFWTTLKHNEFKLAAGASAGALSLEATDFLSSTDPALRDGIAYEALAAWIYRDHLLRADELELVRKKLVGQAQVGIDGGDADQIFGRSFALLGLSVLAAEDLRQPFMSPAALSELLGLGLAALARERDLRGYVAGKGWLHITAHSADLLKFLARNPKTTPAQTTLIVEGVAERTRTAGIVFVWGEDARLAAALRAVAERPDADPAPFSAWCDRLKTDAQAVWGDKFDVTGYVALRGQLNTLAQLAAILPTDAPPKVAQIRGSIVEALAKAG